MQPSCHLVRPDQADEAAVIEMVMGWKAAGGRMHPGLLRDFDGRYAEWLDRLEMIGNGTDPDAEVPQTLYLMKDEAGTILGAVAIRHALTPANFTVGGHLGYGIAPAYRGNGFGSLILRLALEKLAGMGIARVLVTCDADNEASRRVILRNGGVLENQVTDGRGTLVNRYWIGIDPAGL